MVTELDVNRWIMKAIDNPKILSRDEIMVTEVATPCLRRSYFNRVRGSLPTPSEFLKSIGNDVHLKLQEVLRNEGCDTEVSISIELDDFKLRGRIDALCEELGEKVVLEFKTANEIPERPYDSHVMQIQAYLLMLKLRKGYLIYLSRTNGRVKVFKILRDNKAVKKLVERARQLYNSFKDLKPPAAEKGPWCSDCPFLHICNG
jgi:CRISPR-associated protein Cas4